MSSQVKTKSNSKSGIGEELKKNSALFLMLVPGLLVMLVNNYMPMFGLVLAFRRMDNVQKLFGTEWVGLDNFKYLFGSKNGWIITRNTLGYNLVFILIGSTVAVALAIALTELRSKKASKLYQSIFFIPYFFSWVVISYLAFSLLSSESGALNQLIKAFGGQPVKWYVTPKYWPAILIVVNTWKWTGYDVIVYIASIVGISKDYYEAAAVDGATRFQQIRYITIPMLVPLLITLTLIRVGRMFYTDMGLFFTVTRNTGTLYNATNTIDTYVFRGLLSTGDLGMVSAAGFYQAVLGFAVILTFNFIVRKYDKDSALI